MAGFVVLFVVVVFVSFAAVAAVADDSLLFDLLVFVGLVLVFVGLVLLLEVLVLLLEVLVLGRDLAEADLRNDDGCRTDFSPRLYLILWSNDDLAL